MNKILTREEAREMAMAYHSYTNLDYGYQTKGSYWHLIRDEVNLLEGLKAMGCYSYTNGDYSYETNGSYYLHLIRNGVDLLEGLNAIACHSYTNLDYGYRTVDRYWHLIRDGVDLLEGLKAVGYAVGYGNHSNGECRYQTEAGDTILIELNSR